MHDSAFGDCKEVSGRTYARNLYMLARGAKRIIEIGTGWGHSGRAFAMALEGKTNTLLVSVDPVPERIKRVNAKAISQRTEWKQYGDIANVQESDFDLAYVDGDPDMALDDARLCMKRLVPGGLLVLDGYGGQWGPTHASEEMGSFVPIWYCSMYAHAVIRKPTPPLTAGSFSWTCETCGRHTEIPEQWTMAHRKASKHMADTGHSSQYLKSLNRPMAYRIVGARA